MLHADETPVPDVKPGPRQTHRAYLWRLQHHNTMSCRLLSSTTLPTAAPVCMHREFPRELVGKAGLRRLLRATRRCSICGVIEIGCMAHARRKLHDLYANHRSEIAREEQYLRYLPRAL